MAETYKPIFPGNAVMHLQAYGLPNPSFKANSRAVGDPRDRKHQGLMFCPGWIAVRKVGYAHIEDGATSWDVILPSTDLRPDDKAHADVVGMFVPTGAAVMRAGFRVVPGNAQPGFSSGKVAGPAVDVPSGIVGTSGNFLCLSSAAVSASAAGAISATSIKTSSDTGDAGDPASILVQADGALKSGAQAVQAAFGAPVVTTADLTLKLYSIAAAGNALGSAMSSTIPGGAYVVAEVDYLVKEAIADLEGVHLPGARYAGYSG